MSFIRVLLLFVLWLVLFVLFAVITPPLFALLLSGAIVVLIFIISLYKSSQSNKWARRQFEEEQLYFQQEQMQMANIVNTLSKVKIGMSYQEVVEIIGSQGEVISENTETVTYIWSFGHAIGQSNAPAFVVTFADNKATSKECKNLFN